MKARIKLLAASLLLCACVCAHPASIWRHSEAAAKNSVFAELGLAPMTFVDFDFPVFPLELRISCLPPLPLPFSFGLFLKTPNPNLKSFGTRISYHLDIDDPKTDVYFAYVFDFGFLRNGILQEYGDAPVEVHYYDFRIGARYFFDQRLGVAAETDFKVFGLVLSLALKIH